MLMYELSRWLIIWGGLKRSARAVRQFRHLAVLETHFVILWASLLFDGKF